MNVNTQTAAAQANVTTATIRTWCRTGVVSATKQTGRWAIDAASLARRIAIAALKAARKAPAKVVVALTVETLTAIGGRRWQKNGMDRVYINNWAVFAGIEVTHYKSGNVSSASIGGRAIANSRAHGLAGAIDKVWFDAADGRLHFRHYGADAFEIRYLSGDRDHLNLLGLVTAGIRAAIAAL